MRDDPFGASGRHPARIPGCSRMATTVRRDNDTPVQSQPLPEGGITQWGRRHENRAGGSPPWSVFARRRLMASRWRASRTNSHKQTQLHGGRKASKGAADRQIGVYGENERRPKSENTGSPPYIQRLLQ